MKILIVDDEALIARLVFDVLITSGGFNDRDITTCIYAEDALRQITENEDPFDLVITDRNIPNGEEGMHIASTAKMRSADTKVIMISGRFNVDRGLMENIMASRLVDRCLPKPFGLVVLVKVVKDVLSPIATSTAA